MNANSPQIGIVSTCVSIAASFGRVADADLQTPWPFSNLNLWRASFYSTSPA